MRASIWERTLRWVSLPQTPRPTCGRSARLPDRCRKAWPGPLLALPTLHGPLRCRTTSSRWYERGAVDYLAKPFDANILIAKVSVFVELDRQAKRIAQREELLRQKEREDLERRSQLRFQSVTESVAGCIWQTDLEGRIGYANRLARALAPLRGAAGDLVSLAAAEDRVEVAAAWRAALDTGTRLDLECRLASPDGSARWHPVRAVPELDEGGARLGWIVSATDIHDRRIAEEALRATKLELERASEAKDIFLAAASHQLRTPLFAARPRSTSRSASSAAPPPASPARRSPSSAASSTASAGWSRTYSTSAKSRPAGSPSSRSDSSSPTSRARWPSGSVPPRTATQSRSKSRPP